MSTSVTEIAVEVAGALHEVRVTTAQPNARLADVAEAIEPQAVVHTIAIDGVEYVPSTRAADAPLLSGATLRLAPVPSGARPEASVARLAFVAGLHAGTTIDLRPGTVLLGAAPGCDIAIADPAVSSNQALVHTSPLGEVTIEDLAPASPARAFGMPVAAAVAVPPGVLARVGNHVAVVEPPAPNDRAAVTTPKPGDATVGFNRPPRQMTDNVLPPIKLPEHREPGSFAGRVGLLSAVVMLIGGLAAFAIMRSPLTLIFVGVGAVGALASALESRRSARTQARTIDRRQRRELHELRAALADQVRWAEQASWRAQPHIAEITRRALAGSVRLWERRTRHADAFELSVGIGPRSWAPVAADRGPVELDTRVAEELYAASVLQSVPVTVSLAAARSVGVFGDRTAALAVARSLLLQAAVLHGPADLTAVVASSDPAAWDWAKWLPHTVDPQGGRRRLLAATADDLDAVLADLPAAPDHDDDEPGRALLIVVDGGDLMATRTAAVRSVLAGRCGPASLLVVASRADALPADCAAVIEVGAAGRVRVVRPAEGEVVDEVLAAGCDVNLARRCARALARWQDPELDVTGAALPAALSLLDLLGPDATSAVALAQRWRAAGADPAPRAPVAVAVDGVVELDLVRDGPHGLVAGTTGSGKSELLRSVVAGLAARCSPRDLTFVLVDYKGGSAFDLCAQLPHTVGMVTDLDGHLAERALRSLEAELTSRERVFRDAGATDLPAYRRLPVNATAPMPRLAVVIDEFATLASELPDFLDALVGIAQRGRSLGVHLLLATQRPSGAVSENIRANTNLRIALRVQDTADSSDVLNSAVAAQIPRGRPGRMWLRFGPSELVAAQSARATGPARADDAPTVTVEPFVGAAPMASAPVSGASADAGPGDVTELALLVAACTDATASLGLPAPRRPWLDPLPNDLSLASLTTGAVALADLPDEQTQPPVSWDPGAGNLLLYGITGSGTTTTLAALALALASNAPPSERHLYVLDMGAGELAPLRGLPHVGAVVTAPEKERQWRLVRMLKAELDRRRAGSDVDRIGWPAITVLIDGYGALAAEYDDLHGHRLLDDLARVITDGPEVGITCAIAAERPGAVPFSLVTTIARKWLFRLADVGDYASYGIRGNELPTFGPGRAVVADSAVEMQIANPGPLAGAVAAAAARWPSTGARPASIGTLPALVASADLPIAQCTSYPWVVPVGIGDRELAAAALVVHEGEHLLISGPGRSGRTTALGTIAANVRAVRPDVHLVAVTPRRSPLAELCGVERALTNESDLEAIVPTLPRDRIVVLLIDDCESLADDRRVLANLIERRREGLHVVAAGHADKLRVQYGHWTNLVRGSHSGVLLRPNPDTDGDLLHTLLPRRAAVAFSPGRGYVVNEGVAELVQVAVPRPALART